MTARTHRHGLTILTFQAGIAALLLIGWELAADRLVDALLISKPSAVAAQALSWLSRGILQKAVLETMAVVLVGLLWGGAIGVLAGLLLGSARRAGDALEPIVAVLFALPKVALIPLLILWFGAGDQQKIVLVAVTVFFFFFYPVFNGIRAVPRALENMMRLSGASWTQRVRILYLPASIGWLLAALRVALPYAFVAVIGAEVVSSRGGLGHLARTSATVMNAAGTFAAILTLTILATALSGAVIWLAGRTRFALRS